MTKVIVTAAAGSRKTTFIVEESFRDCDLRALILTYTIENLNQIKLYLVQRCGGIPRNVEVMSWYSFLLRECARPYQNYVYDKKRIDSICFVEGPSAKYTRKIDTAKYFFFNKNRIYTDKISEFVCICNRESKGLVIERLESIYSKTTGKI